MAKTIDFEIDSDDGSDAKVVSFRMPKRMEMEGFLSRFTSANALEENVNLMKLLCVSNTAAELDSIIDEHFGLIALVIGEINKRQSAGIRAVKKS